MIWHAAAAKSLQSCPTLCDPIDGSPPGSTVPGILQARTLEWVAISVSNAWKWKVKVKSLSRVWLLATPWTAAHQAPPSWLLNSIKFLWYTFPSISSHSSWKLWNHSGLVYCLLSEILHFLFTHLSFSQKGQHLDYRNKVYFNFTIQRNAAKT